MRLFLLLTIFPVLVYAQQEAPFKSDEAFNVEIEYIFKQRPAQSSNTVNLAETTRDLQVKGGSSPLPYLILKVHIKKLEPNEQRMRVTDNTRRNISNKKLKGPIMIKLDMGFTADVKDGVSPYRYFIYLMNDKKDIISQIIISVEQDGTFLVNNEVRGRF